VPKILILTARAGGGHVSLAESLRDRLKDAYAVEVADPLPRVIVWHYTFVSRHALWMWAAEFKYADTPRRAMRAHRMMTGLVLRPLVRQIKRSQPDLIISTYPFFSYEVTRALRKLRRAIPFAMLFSDPNRVHHTWLTEKSADATFAPTRETYDQALSMGFVPGRLHLTGWPVRQQFYRAGEDRAEILTRLGLDPQRFTVFLQGGGEGSARFARTAENTLAARAQVILATGTNRQLLARFQGVQDLLPLPFTKEIAPFMAAADVVMGKAGPNTMFEAVTLGKPFIGTAYIPGQEEVNLEFIERHQLGWIALRPEAQRELIQALVNEPGRLQDRAASVQAYRNWNTAANETLLPLVRQMLMDASP
jgi:UDP-N-acetylglucosamine:LPS N-acetylglucosamine transferase